MYLQYHPTSGDDLLFVFTLIVLTVIFELIDEMDTIPHCRQKPVFKSVPSKPKQRIFNVRNPLLDFSKSQMSPAYAVCLRNILEDHRGCEFDLRIPGRIYSTAGVVEDTDSNAFAHQATVAVADHSSRGFRVPGWTLHESAYLGTPIVPSCKGASRRRPISPERRMFFPTIIRKDKITQRYLESKHDRDAAIAVLDIARKVYLTKEKRTKIEAQYRKNIVFAKFRKEFQRLLKTTATLNLVSPVKEDAEKARIQQKIDSMASER